MGAFAHDDFSSLSQIAWLRPSGRTPFCRICRWFKDSLYIRAYLIPTIAFCQDGAKILPPQKAPAAHLFPVFPTCTRRLLAASLPVLFQENNLSSIFASRGLTIFGNRAIVTLLFTPFKCPNCTALLCTAPRVLARGLFLSFFLFFPAHFLHKCPPHDTIHTHRQALPKRAGPGFLAFVPLAGICFPFCPKPCFRRTAFTRFAQRRKGRCP